MSTSYGEPVWNPETTIAIEKGTAESATPNNDQPAAVLWIPDPEQRHGWREYYVKREMKQDSKRAMGFHPVKGKDRDR